MQTKNALVIVSAAVQHMFNARNYADIPSKSLIAVHFIDPLHIIGIYALIEG